jgi:hypothetical protein
MSPRAIRRTFVATIIDTGKMQPTFAYTHPTEFVGNTPKWNFTGEINFIPIFPQRGPLLSEFLIKIYEYISSPSCILYAPPISFFFI